VFLYADSTIIAETETAIPNLLASLPSYTVAVFQKVTGDVYRLAKEEWRRYKMLYFLGHGNPERLDSLTELAVDEIRVGLDTGVSP
jgi:hypothetical protein